MSTYTVEYSVDPSPEIRSIRLESYTGHEDSFAVQISTRLDVPLKDVRIHQSGMVHSTEHRVSSGSRWGSIFGN